MLRDDLPIVELVSLLHAGLEIQNYYSGVG